jgi:diaminopimelate epimerase
MKIRFTKMHGAGNDFVVLDAMRDALVLTPEQLRQLADRRYGVGADQILVVGPSATPGVDFSYRIFNATGEEVEHCGNGARCFMRYVREHGLSDSATLKVQTVNNLLVLQWQADGRVQVDMNAPVFELSRVPFRAAGLRPRIVMVANATANANANVAAASGSRVELWPLNLNGRTAEVVVLSMGNPHAVQLVADVDSALVASDGPLIEHHASFPQRVNAGFMQIVSRRHIRLRVFERGAGETLACGTGACAAVVAGIRLGLLDPVVDVDARGGRLTIEWQGGDHHVLMTGPATTVFEGEIDL